MNCSLPVFFDQKFLCLRPSWSLVRHKKLLYPLVAIVKHLLTSPEVVELWILTYLTRFNLSAYNLFTQTCRYQQVMWCCAISIQLPLVLGFVVIRSTDMWTNFRTYNVVYIPLRLDFCRFHQHILLDHFHLNSQSIWVVLLPVHTFFENIHMEPLSYSIFRSGSSSVKHSTTLIFYKKSQTYAQVSSQSSRCGQIF